MFQKIINFVKYHNAFTIGLALVLLVTGGAFANEDIRNAVIGQEIVTEQGIDNSQILATDLDNFDFQLTIQNVREDSQNYYVDYTFQTLAIQENRWQPVLYEATLTISKEALEGRDLGLYVAEELGEVIDYQLSYLKEVQELEREKGQTHIVQTTTYTGLIGLTLNLKDKILPGYEPVVKPPVGEEDKSSSSPFAAARVVEVVQEPIVQEPVCQPIEEICDGIDNNCNNEIDEGGVCPEGEPSAPYVAGGTAPPSPAEPICDATHLNLCSAETDCQSASGYWYNDVCNSEPEPAPTPTSETENPPAEPEP